MSLLRRSVDLTSGRIGALLLVLFGEACLVAGPRDDAMTAARNALELSRAPKERANEAWALRLVGDIKFRGDPTGQTAEADHGQALAFAEKLGMRSLAARRHLG